MERSRSDLESVWLAQTRAATGPRQQLTLDRIVEVAVEVADAEGLPAVSMGRVAREVGFTTMALYRHLASKDALVLHMCDRAVGPPDLPEPTGDWRPDLERWAWGSVRRLRAHPWVVEVSPASGAGATPNQVAWLDWGLGALRPTGLTEGEKAWTLLTLTALTVGDVLYAVADTGDRDAYDAPPAGMLDADRFPHLVQAFASGAFAAADGDPQAARDDEFGFSLTLVLDGVERRVEQR